VTVSPFLTPPGAARTAQRRRRRIRVAAILLVLVLAAGGGVGALRASGGSTPHQRHGRLRAAHAALAASPPRSPAGLPLGAPAFALSGIGDASADPVRTRFHAPPRAGLLFDLDTGRVFWQREAERRLPIASLTKMMTALLTVESAAPRDGVLITRQAVGEGGSKIGLLPLGRKIPVESLLYGLLLPSGNDAAVALAQHVAGSIPAFVARMNAEAARLGMGCTRFSSPSGFYDAANFSCAADLALLAHVDLAQRRIARVVRTRSIAVPFPIKGGKLYLTNNNPLLIFGYPGATGIKTGWTEAAGRCLVATAERHGVRLGVVLLHSDAPGTQARKLLDQAFAQVYHLPGVAEPAMPAQA
jgi:serine-type D-Ala-D-Ala carboxypeptidase (penicillin-binding protein 5/6)